MWFFLLYQPLVVVCVILQHVHFCFCFSSSVLTVVITQQTAGRWPGLLLLLCLSSSKHLLSEEGRAVSLTVCSSACGLLLLLVFIPLWLLGLYFTTVNHGCYKEIFILFSPPDFLFFWGAVFLVTTTLVAFLKKENQELIPAKEETKGITDTYRLLFSIIKMPAVLTFCLLILTSKVSKYI